MMNLPLLTELQRGISLEQKPFDTLGKGFHLTEHEVLSTINEAFETSLARRFGAVYDAASLGYTSTLAAVAIPSNDLERIVKKLNEIEGITHNYLREGSINVWFTLTAHASLFSAMKKEIEQLCFPYTVYFLPVLEKYKVQVLFDIEKGTSLPSEKPCQTQCLTLTDFQKQLIAISQTNIPLESRPFQAWAQKLKTTEMYVLENLKYLKSTGALRRLALVVRHQKAGVGQNVMATWRIDPKISAELGEKLAQCAGVSHCYLRDVPSCVGGNLYAMMHGKDQDDLNDKIQQAQILFSDITPQLFKTLSEFKKTSPFFFKEALLDG